MGVPFINFKNNLYTAEVSINFGIIQKTIFVLFGILKLKFKKLNEKLTSTRRL